MFKTSLRLLAFGNHAMVFLSSLIVTGILSYFINKYGSENRTHLIYEEVIAVLTFVVWLFGMVLPLVDRYGGHLWPANLVLSYLWLTSFIFSAQDWAQDRCTYNGPAYGKCALKKTVISFNFFAFFFLMCNVVIEGHLFHTHRRERVNTASVTKDRSLGNSVPAEERV